MTSREVLFIDYFFPPLAGDFRGLAFAKYLPTFGWRLRVLSAADTVRYDKDYSLLDQLPADLRVDRVGHSTMWRRIWSAAGIAGLGMPFPDIYHPWIQPALEAGRRILREGSCAVIYSASPTFSTAAVAATLSREFNLPWVADFLDSWSKNSFFLESVPRRVAAPLRKSYLRRIAGAEAEYIRHAAFVTCIHQSVVREFERTHRISGSKFRFIPDGYDEESFAGLVEKRTVREQPIVTFLGSYYSAYREYFELFARVLYRVAPSARLQFVGRCAAAVRKLQLPGAVCIDALPRREAFNLALGSDFLLTVMPPHAEWTPTKCYDYLRLGRPVLAMVPESGDVAVLLRSIGGGAVIPYDETRLSEILSDILTRRGAAPIPPVDALALSRYERRVISGEMAEVFEAVAGNRSA